MGMTLNEFIEKYEGKRVGVYEEGMGQCTGLAQVYARDCLDVASNKIPSGHAKTWVTELPKLGIVKKVNDPKPGDIVVCPNKGYWNGELCGHIGIVVNNNKMFEQNLCLEKQGETKDTPVVHTARIKRDFNNFILGDNGYYIFRPTKNSEPSIPPVKPETPGLYLLALENNFKILSKPNNGSLLVNVPKGKYATIIELLDEYQSDGFQWAKVNYNGTIGYAKLNVYEENLFICTSNRTLYLYAKNSKFHIRNSQVNGKVLTSVPKGEKATILAFDEDFSSDGYQWAYVSYGKYKGYSQIDTEGFNMVTL